MHSSELPVTDWWDPEWDVYDVPLCPPGDWENPAKPELYDAWWVAYCFLWDLRWVMYGSAEYRPDFRGRELTQHAYPGQPATRTRPPTKPCTCRYFAPCCQMPLGEPETRWCMWTASHFHQATAFRIHPTCPHHGRAELTIEALWNDPALNAMRDPYDLDDNERRS